MPTSTTGSSNRQSGFTLIELGVVILLISLFTLISVPLLSNTARGNVEASARKLSGTVKYLFNEAALSGLEHRLVYNLDDGSYRGLVLETDGSLVDIGGPGKKSVLKRDVRFTGLTLPGRGSFSSGEVTVRIHPTGWLEETVVHLDDGKGGSALTMRINPLTGSSEIFEGFREFQLN